MAENAKNCRLDHYYMCTSIRPYFLLVFQKEGSKLEPMRNMKITLKIRSRPHGPDYWGFENPRLNLGNGQGGEAQLMIHT